MPLDFLTGEGCITLHRGSGTRSLGNVTLRTIVANTNPEPLKMFHATWGGSLSVIQQRNNWKPRWQWSLSTLQAEEFLLCIEPHVIIKKQVLHIALEYCKFVRSSNRYVLKWCGQRRCKVRSKETLAMEDKFIARIHAVNKKGIAI